MKRRVINKKSGNEQVEVSASIDNGKTTIEIRVYSPTGRTIHKKHPFPKQTETSS